MNGLVAALLQPTVGALAATATRETLNEEKSALMTLADLLLPEESLIGALLAAYQTRYESDWRKEDGAAAEADFPGIRVAGLAAGRNAYQRVLRASLPDLKRQFAEMADGRFSASELQQVTDFFDSAAGRLTMSAIVDQLFPTAGAIQMETRAGSKIEAEASRADRSAIEQFLASESSGKMRQLRIDFRPTMSVWAAKANKEAGPLVEAAVEKAAANFIASRARQWQ